MTVIYLHSPRTGGTSMAEIMGQVYGKPSWDPFHDGVWMVHDEGLKYLRSQNEFTGSCIIGHMPYGVHKYVGSDFTYLTMLRDPVERITSYYYYVMAIAGYGWAWWEQTVGLTRDTTLSEFAQMDMCHVRNSMTRQFCGLPFYHEKAKKIQVWHVNKAEKNLEQMHVGVTEHFGYSVDLFSKQLGWPKVNVVKEHARPHPAPTLEEAAIIRKNNRYDCYLHKLYMTPF